ncbi:MAG: hypothetical protein BAJALOKI1v1_780011 [Promethearchaeota archaeon]|nr:MAG: hypothetical protein BAJALOKI1v1_780011 [Candidatus Lokiarchaeota archaeon]
MPPTRDLPISLQGIETVLKYLSQHDNELSSIRSISTGADLSMRVVQNVLLQLEKFNQVERVVEKNKVMPKWKITKFGKKVLKQAQGEEVHTSSISKENELLQDITIPKDLEEVKEMINKMNEILSSNLKSLQIELSRILGIILNLGDPLFEDLMGFIIKRVKYLKQIISLIPQDPLKKYELKKADEKRKKIKDKEAKQLLIEALFIDQIIINETKYISALSEKMSQYIENDMNSTAYSIAKDLREELRELTNLIENRKQLDINLHLFLPDEIKAISNNEIGLSLLDKLMNKPIRTGIKEEAIKKTVLELLGVLNKNQKMFKNHTYEIKDNIPLYALYQLILDEKPAIRFSIEELEYAINQLADEGYIPGIKIIEEDEAHYFKVVQLKAHDISEDERQLISIALDWEKLSMADVINETGWSKEKTQKILDQLTEIGILKYSKSLLHGDQWYIVSR